MPTRRLVGERELELEDDVKVEEANAERFKNTAGANKRGFPKVDSTVDSLGRGGIGVSLPNPFKPQSPFLKNLLGLCRTRGPSRHTKPGFPR
jgi:hypothetical protein